MSVPMRRFAIIGLGRFGSTLATALAERGADVVAIDSDPARVEAVAEVVAVAACGDATHERFLAANGVDRADVAIVGMGNAFEATQLCLLALKELGVPRVITKSPLEVQARILEAIGADEVISPERESALRLVQRLLAPNLIDYVELAGGNGPSGLGVAHLPVPADWIGKSILQLDIRRSFGVQILVVEEKGRGPGSLAALERPFQPDDVLIVLGEQQAIERLAS